MTHTSTMSMIPNWSEDISSTVTQCDIHYNYFLNKELDLLTRIRSNIPSTCTKMNIKLLMNLFNVLFVYVHHHCTTCLESENLSQI